jgi:coenzyme F420-0:L-glutamate ligase/coenzyme F420-1:gamma-L-glutamate ligase
MQLTLTPIYDIPRINAHDDLGEILITAVNHSTLAPSDGDIWVVAQKIVSKAEGRLINLNQITPTKRAKEIAIKTNKDARFVQLVLNESNEVLRVKPGALIVEHKCGFICANAGIDHSNVENVDGDTENWFLLLPEDPGRSAKILRAKLEAYFKKQFGVLIIDSHGRAWRNGTVGMSIGLSGLPGVVDLRGTPDMNGFQLQITQVGCADELAAAASLVMGQAAEMTPVVHVSGFPYALREGDMRELIRKKDEDLFR